MKKKGFTLTEVVVVSFILVILVGILAITVMGTRSIFETSDISVALQANTRAAINKIALDLRRTAQGQINITQNDPVAGSDKIVYHLPSDSDNDGVPDLNSEGKIIWDNTNITIGLDISANELYKEVQGGSVEILASNVKKVNFVDHNIDSSLYLDELKVILELEKTTSVGRVFSLNSTSVINMRN